MVGIKHILLGQSIIYYIHVLCSYDVRMIIQVDDCLQQANLILSERR